MKFALIAWLVLRVFANNAPEDTKEVECTDGDDKGVSKPTIHDDKSVEDEGDEGDDEDDTKGVPKPTNHDDNSKDMDNDEEDDSKGVPNPTNHDGNDNNVEDDGDEGNEEDDGDAPDDTQTEECTDEEDTSTAVKPVTVVPTPTATVKPIPTVIPTVIKPITTPIGTVTAVKPIATVPVTTPCSTPIGTATAVKPVTLASLTYPTITSLTAIAGTPTFGVLRGYGAETNLAPTKTSITGCHNCGTPSAETSALAGDILMSGSKDMGTLSSILLGLFLIFIQ